jgi:uncharacterized membrane protein HdeD (DUF308 family)
MESSSDFPKLAKTQVSKFRWALGIRGALAVTVGVLILAWPEISLYALTLLVGAYALVSGLFEFGFAFTKEAKDDRGWFIFSGLVGIAFGIMVLVWPNISALALLYVIGAYAIIIGMIMIVSAFRLPIDGRDTALMIFGGLVAIVFGVVMFAKPGAGALATLALISAFALVTGLTQLVLAIGGKQIAEHWVKKHLTLQQPQQPQQPQQQQQTRKPQPSH